MVTLEMKVGTRQIVGIGNSEAQQNFMSRNKNYLEEWGQLQPLIGQVFLNRTIHPPSKEEWDRVAHLPEDDPAVLALDDKYKADVIVYTLGRIAVDDFSELITLAGNGWGVGALKILRGMYERIVTSAYIAKKPEASRAFGDSFWTHRLKLWNRLRKVDPEIEKRTSPEVVETVKMEGKKAQERRNVTVCKYCNQIKSVDAWTPLDLASMAKTAGKSLEDLYAFCYLDPTSHMHATGAGVTARMTHTTDVWRYKLDTTEESQIALHLGHNLMLQNLGVQNEYFSLGLTDSIRPRLEAFRKVWKEDKITDTANQ
jgi:Family of unknown function (DUF5677)